MKIQLKRSNQVEADGSAKKPTAAQMEYGELAVNYNAEDPAIFLEDSDGDIIRIAGANALGNPDIPETPGDIGADLQAVTDVGNTTTNGATFGGEVQVRNLNANYRLERTGAIFQGFDGAADGDPANFTSQINSDGSAKFTNRIDLNGGVTVDGGASMSTGFYYRDDSVSNGLAFYSGGASQGNRKVFIKTDGSATFASSITAGGNGLQIESDGQLTVKKQGDQSAPYIRVLNRADAMNDAVLVYGDGSASFAKQITATEGYALAQLPALEGV